MAAEQLANPSSLIIVGATADTAAVPQLEQESPPLPRARLYGTVLLVVGTPFLIAAVAGFAVAEVFDSRVATVVTFGVVLGGVGLFLLHRMMRSHGGRMSGVTDLGLIVLIAAGTIDLANGPASISLPLSIGGVVLSVIGFRRSDLPGRREFS